MSLETTSRLLKTVAESERAKNLSKDLIRESQKTVQKSEIIFNRRKSKFSFVKVDCQKCGITQQRLKIQGKAPAKDLCRNCERLMVELDNTCCSLG